MLTQKRKKVLNFIASYQKKRGYAPALEEIARHLKVASVSTAHHHINRLEQGGYLKKQDNQPRAIEVVQSHLPFAPEMSVKVTWQINPIIDTGISKKKGVALNKIILGDCVKVLNTLPQAHFDAVIIDPPYNIGKDFGNNTDRRELSDYLAWADQWMESSLRALKPTGTLFIYGFSEILAHLSTKVPLSQQRWLVWHYTNKNVASLNFWQRSHESILCIWKDERIFNRDAVREPYTEGFLQGAAGKKRKDTAGRFSRGGVQTTYNAHECGALPRDVIKIPALAGGAGMVERWFLCKTCDQVYEPRQLKKHISHNIMKHPTQKPLELTRRLLKSCLLAKNTSVLIPFAGTGSECVIARELGADYLGIEINPDYVKLAQGFIRQVRKT